MTVEKLQKYLNFFLNFSILDFVFFAESVLTSESRMKLVEACFSILNSCMLWARQMRKEDPCFDKDIVEGSAPSPAINS